MDKSMTATLKYALASDKKMSLMAKLVKGKKVEDALNTLYVLPKKQAKILYKLIKSAASNAKNAGAEKGLYIKEIRVGTGPKIKRIKFTSRSRIGHYEKSRSFVQVILEVRKNKDVEKVETSVKSEKAPKAVAPKKATPQLRAGHAPAPKKSVKK